MKQPETQRSPVDSFAAAAADLNAHRPIRRGQLRKLIETLQNADPERSEQELRAYLDSYPDDPDALSMLANVAAARGRRKEAALLFARAVELAPDFDAARFTYAELLFALNRFDAALAEADRLLAQDGGNPLFRQLKAKVLDSLGRTAEALAIVEHLARDNPERADSWMTYGHALRAAGHQKEAVAAYRKAIALRPTWALPYANLANLKTFRFSEDDIAIMEDLLKRQGLAPDDRTNLQFALGKVREDRGEYARAFECYAKGNAAARLRFVYDPDALTAGMRRTKAVFTREFFERRAAAGCPAPDPIFIVGRQRSGSTLIEQILASHSAIEGTAELPYVPDIAGEIADIEGPAGGSLYFENLAKLTPDSLAAYGERYLARARLHRKTARPFFIDKNPGNHFHVGLIALILPKAKIIDARRNPAAACWSQFTHQFTAANLRLVEFAQAWRDYAELMAHFDSVFPGKIHRVSYETLVTDTGTELQRLLGFLGLPFEEQCLRFYETDRPVLTPSSEQVRRPIGRDAIDHWRHFEPWVSPLVKTLGDSLINYPDLPEPSLS